MDPLTKLQHTWIAITVNPVVVFRRQGGEIVAIVDEEGPPAEVQIGCALCDATPDEGWGRICTGEDVA